VKYNTKGHSQAHVNQLRPWHPALSHTRVLFTPFKRGPWKWIQWKVSEHNAPLSLRGLYKTVNRTVRAPGKHGRERDRQSLVLTPASELSPSGSPEILSPEYLRWATVILTYHAGIQLQNTIPLVNVFLTRLGFYSKRTYSHLYLRNEQLKPLTQLR